MCGQTEGKPLAKNNTPTQTPPPASENNAPEWDASLGVSKEDWDSFFGGGNTTGQHTWTPNYGNGVYEDENGNICGDPGAAGIEDPSKIGSLDFH